MAGEDDFDIREWGPELGGPSDTEDSPEPVTLAPKKVAYTTVGSIVNPNLVPQFAAPNRIQREGSGRRTLPAMGPGYSRHHDTYYQTRNQSQQLNTPNSMHYTQQFSQSPVNANFNYTHTGAPAHANYNSRSTRTGTEGMMMELTEDEIGLVRQLRGEILA